MLTLSNKSKKNFRTWSNKRKKIDIAKAIKKTIIAPCSVSLPVGHETLNASCFTSCINLIGFFIFLKFWQERRDSNPQPPVLETGALPIELHSYIELTL